MESKRNAIEMDSGASVIEARHFNLLELYLLSVLVFTYMLYTLLYHTHLVQNYRKPRREGSACSSAGAAARNTALTYILLRYSTVGDRRCPIVPHQTNKIRRTLNSNTNCISGRSDQNTNCIKSKIPNAHITLI